MENLQTPKLKKEGWTGDTIIKPNSIAQPVLEWNALTKRKTSQPKMTSDMMEIRMLEVIVTFASYFQRH